MAIWAVIEGNKLREIGRESTGIAIMVSAISIAVLRIGLYSAGIWP